MEGNSFKNREYYKGGKRKKKRGAEPNSIEGGFFVTKHVVYGKLL